MNRTVIGILAGMGPRTTTPFLEKLLDLSRSELGAVWDEDYPEMVIYSLPTPFRPDRPLNRAGMISALERGASALRKSGADFVVVPCNVAHIFYNEICKAAGIPILHIVEQAIANLPPPEGVQIAVLATDATIASGLYQNKTDRFRIQSF